MLGCDGRILEGKDFGRLEDVRRRDAIRVDKIR